MHAVHYKDCICLGPYLDSVVAKTEDACSILQILCLPWSLSCLCSGQTKEDACKRCLSVYGAALRYFSAMPLVDESGIRTLLLVLFQCYGQSFKLNEATRSKSHCGLYRDSSSTLSLVYQRRKMVGVNSQCKCFIILIYHIHYYLYDDYCCGVVCLFCIFYLLWWLLMMCCCSLLIYYY